MPIGAVGSGEEVGESGACVRHVCIPTTLHFPHRALLVIHLLFSAGVALREGARVPNTQYKGSVHHVLEE